jgi:hypothetical protein
MQDLTLEVVAHHPQLLIMHDETSGDTRGMDITGFTLVDKPFDNSVGKILVDLWIMRRGLRIQFNKVGIIDHREKKIYLVDYLVEAGRTPLFVVWYSSERRRQDRKIMQKYAEDVSNACERVFGQRVGIIMVNMYHSGVEGGLTQGLT